MSWLLYSALRPALAGTSGLVRQTRPIGGRKFRAEIRSPKSPDGSQTILRPYVVDAKCSALNDIRSEQRRSQNMHTKTTLSYRDDGVTHQFLVNRRLLFWVRVIMTPS